MIKVLVNTNDATRIQSSGGTISQQYALGLGATIAGDKTFISMLVKNQGAKTVIIGSNGNGSDPSATVPPGVTKQVTIRGTSVGNSFQITFNTQNIGDAFDVVAFNPIATKNNGPNLVTPNNATFIGWAIVGGATIVLTQNQLRTVDYTKYVDTGSLSITDDLNQPAQCKFSLTNLDDVFIAPVREAYVQVFSTQYNRFVFTGYISVDYERDYIGMNSKTPSTNFQTYRYLITCAGDEYLLASKAVPLLPPFVNMGTGQILASLANVLAPRIFDVTSKCASGDLIPYQEYDPTKNWTVMAKEFADQFRYRVRILNKVLFFQPFGDQKFPIKYDDTTNGRTFDPSGLKTSIYNTTLANDAIIIGDVEPSDNHEDYFVGDGFTSDFPLRYTVFDGDTAHLLNEDWSSSSIDPSRWFEQDPTNIITPVGALNVNGGTNHFGDTYLYLRTGIDFGRKIVLNHGQVFFVGNCSGAIIGGVYDNASTFAEINGSGQCECGFDVRPASGFTIAVSVSGTSGLQIQPRRLGQLIGTPVITQQNHYYVLRTIINGRSTNRYTTTFKSLTGAIVQGGTNSAIGDITWVITDIDLNNTNPNMPGFVNTQPPFVDTRFTLRNVSLPAFGTYALLNISNANLTIQWTDLFDPPQGQLSAAALSGVSGGQLPILPNSIGPSFDYELGFGIGRQVATLGNSSASTIGAGSSDGTGSVLQFYSDSIPGVGSRIRLHAHEAKAAIARVQDPVSIQKQAAVVGDDGHRVAIISDFKPLPRSSEECELAGKAALMDRTQTIYQGSYTVDAVVNDNSFFDFINNDYPRTGEFFIINSPQRNLINFSAVCTSVTIKYKELWSEWSSISVGFGPTTFLQNLLALFVPKPNNTLLPQNTAQPPTPIQLANIGLAFCQDLNALTLSGGPTPSLGFDSFNIYVNTGIDLLANQFIEVRQTNFGWGKVNNDRLGIFNTRTFTLPRTRFDGTWYFRMLQGSFDGAGNLIAGGLTSRRSKVIRVYAPIVPAPPQVLYADSMTIKGFYNGDIRNIYGVELRGPDNATVLVQKPVATPTDMELDLIQLGAGKFWNASTNLLLATEEFNNPLWTGFGISVSGDAAFDPNNNSQNADLISFPPRSANSLNGIAQVVNVPALYGQPSSIAGMQFCFSVWLRTSGGTLPIELVLEDSPFSSIIADSVVNVTNQWKQFNIFGTVPAGTNNKLAVFIQAQFSVGTNASNVFVWGAQLEVGNSPSTYLTNVNSYGLRNLLEATEEFDNQDIWFATQNPSVTGGFTQVDLSPFYNQQGLTLDGAMFSNSFAGSTNGFGLVNVAFSSTAIGTSLSTGGISFQIGSPGVITDTFAGGALSANWTSVEGTFTVAANKVQGATVGANGRGHAVRNDQVYPADQFAQATYNPAPANGSTMGVVVRASSNVESYYAAYNDTTTLFLFKMVNGALTVLSSVLRTPATNDKIKLQVVGSVLNVIVNGVALLTATDTTFSNGSPGITSVNISGLPTSAQLSSFFAGAASPKNIMYGGSQTVPLPVVYANSVRIIANAAFSSTGQVIPITVTYSDGTSVVFTQTISEINTPLGLANETIAISSGRLNLFDGTFGSASDNLYAYKLTVDPTKRLRSITFGPNINVFIFSIAVTPIVYQTTVTPNALRDPIGNLSADAINYAPKTSLQLANMIQNVTPSLVKNKTFTFSIWLKTSGANVTGNIFVQDIPFTQNGILKNVVVTNQWQQFFGIGSFNSSANGLLTVGIGLPSGIASGAALLYAWGAQLEFGNVATTYLGNGNVLRPFYMYFFNLMWSYSLPTIVQIGSPSPPILSIGAKLANLLELHLDRLIRPDVKSTIAQVTTDGAFLSTGAINVTGNGQPDTFNVNVSNIGLSGFFARSRRTDYFSNGPWSSIFVIPPGYTIGSTHAVGQGSSLPVLDNQVTALFTFTTTSNGPGGANTGRVVISWPTFTIVYPDKSQQAIPGNSFDTGTVLTTSTSTTTSYIFYPRAQANILNAPIEFVNGAHASQSPADAQACVTDGYIGLGGSSISITVTLLAAPAASGSPPAGGGGFGGGDSCIVEDETVETADGDILAKDVKLGQLWKSIDPETLEEHFSVVDSFCFAESICVEIEREDGSKTRCSTSTDIPVWREGKFIGYVKAKQLTVFDYMFSNKKLSRIKAVKNIGSQRVVQVILLPYHTLIAGNGLTHNGVLPRK